MKVKKQIVFSNLVTLYWNFNFVLNFNFNFNPMTFIWNDSLYLSLVTSFVFITLICYNYVVVFESSAVPL